MDLYDVFLLTVNEEGDHSCLLWDKKERERKRETLEEINRDGRETRTQSVRSRVH